MGTKRIWICDKCGAELDWNAECNNGTTENMRFRVQNKIAEHIPGQSFWQRCYKTVIMCPACWAEFEKVYMEFMGE